MGSRTWYGLVAAAATLWACGSSDLFGSGPTQPAGGSGGSGASAEAGAGGLLASGGAGGVSGGGVGGGAVGAPCQWDGPPCAPGLYCEAPGCGAGTCEHPLPSGQQQSAYEPVCGCDGVTYWNGSIAASLSVSVLQADVCEAGVPCHPEENPCPADRYCNRQINNAGSCLSDPVGACWGLPEHCADEPPDGRPCLSTCGRRCDVIRDESVWYTDGFCN